MVALLVLMTLGNCAPLGPAEVGRLVSSLAASQAIPAEANQLLVATNREAACVQASVLALERTATGWKRALPAFDAVVGRKGFAPSGAKREGDGMSPSGVYALGTAFGYAARASTKLPYRQTTADDVWVDDAASADYNRWVAKIATTAASFEALERDDGLYEEAVVIEYNTQPVVAGRGSAIFLHIWRAAGKGTAGCVATAKTSLRKLTGWLDPAQSPRILMGTFQELCGCSP